MHDLFTYPHSPGHGGPETSTAAAEDIKGRAETLRGRVMELLQAHPGGLTADEGAALLGEDWWSIRPRFSELVRFNLVEDSGERRLNESGKRAVVWRVVK
jgi:hypothetical protein